MIMDNKHKLTTIYEGILTIYLRISWPHSPPSLWARDRDGSEGVRQHLSFAPDSLATCGSRR